MKCNSCEANIDPKWKHAIENNVCPFCGEVIMEEHLKTLLSDARNILDELNGNYKEQFVEWAKKNYNLVYVEDQQQLERIEKTKTIESGMKRDNNDFFKRAEVKPKEKPQVAAFARADKDNRLKKLAQKISDQNEEAEYPEDISAIQISEEDSQPADDYELERAKELISRTYGVSSDPDDEEIPQVIADMARLKGAKDYNAKDVFKLQQSFAKTQESREYVRNGGGGKKGSFSRAG